MIQLQHLLRQSRQRHLPLQYFLLLLLLMQPQPALADKTFTYCAEANPLTFNAQLATDGATFNASSRPLYNRLVGFEAGTTRVGPSLATSWSVSADGREFIFHLREGVKFHTTDYFRPTRSFNADDVIFSFNRMQDKTHNYHSIGGGQYPSFQAQQMGEIIKKIEKIDDTTIRFSLHRPEAPFLANLAMDFASILSAEYAEKLWTEKKPENIDRLPIGTGPFIFVWFEKGKSIHYKANKDYFEGAAKINQLIFNIVLDPSLRLQKLQNGECQFMPEPAPESLSTIRADPQLKLLQQPGLNIAYLAMPTQKAPFKNILVRKAIHHALNRTKYISEIYGGNAQVAKNPIPPTMWSYNRHTQDYDYSVTKAKKYLTQANMAEGFETDLWFADVSRPYNPNAKKMAELIQKDLAEIGVRVKLHQVEWQEFLKQSRKGQFALSLQGWTGDNGDPDNFLNNLLSCQSINAGNNRAQWCHKKFSFLVDRARVTTNIRARTKFYQDAQKIFKDEVPWVTIAHSIVFKVARKNVEGYRISPFGVVDFHKVTFSK